MALLLKENTKIAMDAIKSNRLRAIITMLIIAIGIMALVGILSAIDAIKSSKFGLPDWSTIAKTEHISLDYLQARVEWMRKVGMIK